MLPRVVMKFGGTSLGSAEAMQLAAGHIAREKQPALVVVSAVGGVTDLLLEVADQARQGQDVEDGRQRIHQRHARISEDLGLDPGLLEDLEQRLEHLAQGISLLRELTPRVRDEVLSLGERMSVRLLAALLCRCGTPARPHGSWEMGLDTDDQHGAAQPLPQANSEIRCALEALDPQETPVVTGFLGRSPQGDITTLGRGGSDFSAAVFGAAAGVEEIQIWTDVAGILRADPRVVEGAQVIPSIHFEEAAELAFFGAKVLHPRTLEPARQQGIPVRVLGTFQVNPGEPIAQQGTLICEEPQQEPVRALAMRQEVQSLQVHSLHMLEAHGFLSRIFDVLARHRISVDVVATSEVSVSMTFDRIGASLSAAVSEIAVFAQVEVFPRRCILCLVGSGLRCDTSLLARVFDVLAAEEVPVHVISQGASRINITLVTDPQHAPRAMGALHRMLFTLTEPGPSSP